MEAKIPVSKLEETMKVFRGNWKWLANEANCRNRMIVIWNPDKVELNVIRLTYQAITMDAKLKSNQKGGRVSFV